MALSWLSTARGTARRDPRGVTTWYSSRWPTARPPVHSLSLQTGSPVGTRSLAGQRIGPPDWPSGLTDHCISLTIRVAASGVSLIRVETSPPGSPPRHLGHPFSRLRHPAMLLRPKG